uniref:Uncharacterized protein n=1 Tax=viral metagenome TaxID=1070528 RepID=A0A6C0EGF0_9ZZZZ
MASIAKIPVSAMLGVAYKTLCKGHEEGHLKNNNKSAIKNTLCTIIKHIKDSTGGKNNDNILEILKKGIPIEFNHDGKKIESLDIMELKFKVSDGKYIDFRTVFSNINDKKFVALFEKLQKYLNDYEAKKHKSQHGGGSRKKENNNESTSSDYTICD